MDGGCPDVSLSLEMLQAIDARIDRARERTTATGSVADIIDTTTALVTFDGSAFAVQVKLAGDADINPGDRVALVKFGIWWVAICPLTRRWQPHSGASIQQGVGTTVSATYADVPVAVSVSFVKKWDATRVFVIVNGAGFSTAINTEAFFGANFSSTQQPAIATVDIASIFWNNASEHLRFCDWRYVTGLAADTYTVKVQWLRNAGAGTVSVDVKDRIAINVMEVSPT